MFTEKGNTQALFHFLMSELLVQCSEHIKGEQDSVDNKMRDIGCTIGFKIYNQICLRRGITERPQNIMDILKSIKTKVFKHLFNYELSPDTNTYNIEEKRAVVYGVVDEVSIYLAWMPENCQSSASMLVAGIIQGILNSNDIKCIVSSRKLQSEKQDKNLYEYLVEMDMEESNRWEKK